jgi:L-ascorbate metabolism protein UlaG (beta-lactamase superfamily)
MEITWLGWDSFKVKTSGKIIYFDPTLGDLHEPADLILVSHGHSDHSQPDILARIRKPATVVLTSKENKDKINGIGLVAGEARDLENIHVIACQAYNIVRMRQPGVPFHPKGYGLGWIVESEGKRIYFPGDTELIPDMETLGVIDLMMVPISGTYVMDIEEAVRAVKVIKPKIVIPMHFGIFDISFGKQPAHFELQADPLEFARKLEGVTEVRVLKPGEFLTI